MTVPERAARSAVHRLLSRLRGGRLTVSDARGVSVFGEPGGVQARMEVRSPAVYAAFLRGSLGLAESYMDAQWESDDLVALARLGARNMAPLDALRTRLLPLTAPLQAAIGWLERNTPRRSRRRISAHYDLGNDLFEAMLDPTLTYSCGIFANPRSSLQEAQLNKLETICRTLRLKPGDRLLEIGTGWGALALHAAAHHGALVTTTTISREQRELAESRVRAAGLENRVRILDRDYRELDGRYAKLVSIEMIEAVGWLHLDTFFERCSQLLEPDGTMLLQAITIADGAYEVEKQSRSFIKRHVFPGGCLPSAAAIERSLASASDLRTVATRDLTEHYPNTLRAWRERFEAGSRTLGLDDRFRRLWRLYLSYCEGGFLERRIEVGQRLLAKPRYEAAGAVEATRRLAASR